MWYFWEHCAQSSHSSPAASAETPAVRRIAAMRRKAAPDDKYSVDYSRFAAIDSSDDDEPMRADAYRSMDFKNLPKAAAPCAVKTELVNDHFVPSEHKAPKCEVTIGFDDDGARTLSSGAKRRAFSRCCVEAFETPKPLTVEPLGLAVRVNQEGKPELAATLVITGDRSSIEERVEAWASRVEAGEVTVRGLSLIHISEPTRPY